MLLNGWRTLGLTMKTDKELILSIKDGEERYFDCSPTRWKDRGLANILSDGGALVTFGNGIYTLYEIPLFGGEPMLVKYYKPDQVDEMIAEYRSWT